MRLHEDGAAASAARSIGARAFTLGGDIAFAQGEYAPGTREGRRLLAHESAHVVQQAREPDTTVRRITYGTEVPKISLTIGSPVKLGGGAGGRAFPRRRRALALIDQAVYDRSGYSECHDHFASRCPGGTRDTLTDVWRSAMLWRITARTARMREARFPVATSPIPGTVTTKVPLSWLGR